MSVLGIIGLSFSIPEIIIAILYQNKMLFALGIITLSMSFTAIISNILVLRGYLSAGIYFWNIGSILSLAIVPLVATGFISTVIVGGILDVLIISLFISPRKIKKFVVFISILVSISTLFDWLAPWQRLNPKGYLIIIPFIVNTISVPVISILIILLGDTLLKALEITESYVGKLEQASKDELKYIATHDTLTNLPNRILLNNVFHQNVSRAKHYNEYLAICMLDLDYFKKINDTYGHSAGDQVLIVVSKRLKENLSESSFISRMGGDEFVVLIHDMQNSKDCKNIAERLIEQISKPIKYDSKNIQIGVSIGISIYPLDGDDIEILLKNADIALYSAKEAGRNTYQFFSSDLNMNIKNRVELGNDLIKAVELNEFFLNYQPLVDFKTEKIAGIEALVRWNHPKLGIINPTKFIPLAEESGLIIQIGNWVLLETCRQAKIWQDTGYFTGPIAVNLSVKQFYSEGLINTISKILHDTGLKPKNLELEITESNAMQKIEVSEVILKQLKDIGVKIIIDDFGSGYSSLYRLSKLSIDAIKIDRFFFQNMIDDTGSTAIIMSIISMARHLNLEIIAEGIESREQLNFLKSLQWFNVEAQNCDRIQGFLFSKPLNPDDMTLLLKEYTDK